MKLVGETSSVLSDTPMVSFETKRNKRESFGRKHRLNDSGLIRGIREAGKKIYKSRFLVYRHRNPVGYPRVAIALTRRTGSSVLRNKIKRRFREFFRKNKQALGSYDYFIYAPRSLSRIKGEEWGKILQDILENCG